MSCHICREKGNKGLSFPLGYIPDAKKTCAEIATLIYKEPLTTSECKIQQTKYLICCNGTRLIPRPPSKVKPPQVVYKGPHPPCELCIGNGYPQDPSHVIHLLYIGASSCKNYYIAGKEGKIPRHLCDPLRYFAREPCNCPLKAVTRSPPTETTIAPMLTTLLTLTYILVCISFVMVMALLLRRYRSR